MVLSHSFETKADVWCSTDYTFLNQHRGHDLVPRIDVFSFAIKSMTDRNEKCVVLNLVVCKIRRWYDQDHLKQADVWCSTGRYTHLMAREGMI